MSLYEKHKVLTYPRTDSRCLPEDYLGPVKKTLAKLGPLAPGHRTDYQRVLSRAPWSGVRLGCALADFLLRANPPPGTSVRVTASSSALSTYSQPP